MNINSFLLERALKQLDVPESALEQLRLATALSDVNGKGFPKDLFQLNIRMIVRGLLNFGTLQMNRDWVYPYWVQPQLDRTSKGYVARSQNPLLINITNRNWTALGSPTGLHEAIVDPRGLVTPLPREWSLDVWLHADGKSLFPSLAPDCSQSFDAQAPSVTTEFQWNGLRLLMEAFVGTTKKGSDVLFQQATVVNLSPSSRSLTLFIAVRPFNPEGVAPIRSIEFRHPRQVYVNNIVGAVFSKEPDAITLGNANTGDISNRLNNISAHADATSSISCEKGLAHAVAAYQVHLAPQESWSTHASIALGTETEVRKHPVKQSWRVSYQHRREKQRAVWESELSNGAKVEIPDTTLQHLFDSSLATLLELHDGDFISPGPFLYHHFWFRDAAPMVLALDSLGFAKRTRTVIDAFPKRMMPDGFFRAPDGEWDSNGAVLWTVYKHFLLTRSSLWLKHLYPTLSKAAHWILRTKNQTSTNRSVVPGLMPRSISAEHLGPVDQYYWDSFWSLAGLRAMAAIAKELQKKTDQALFEASAEIFEHDVRRAIKADEQRLGRPLIPAGPWRTFDEGAIGSICCLYPLELFNGTFQAAEKTVHAIKDQFVDTRGFYHPLIHSGYNAYLTLQLAHCYLNMGDTARAWQIAESIFKQASPTDNYPEAIHPMTGGGSMGDGHHGWAAAEVILFLRDLLVKERGDVLQLLHGAELLFNAQKRLSVSDLPTDFGTLSFSIEPESINSSTFRFSHKFFPTNKPKILELHLPFIAAKIMPAVPSHLLAKEFVEKKTILKLSPEVTTLFFQFNR